MENETQISKVGKWRLKTQQKIFKIKLPMKKNSWTSEEDSLLLELIEKNGAKNWKQISKYFDNKKFVQCSSRYKRLKKGIKKNPWSTDEENLILALIGEHGKNWSKIAGIIKNRTGKQIRERYINKLDPKIQKKEFSEEEDIKILELKEVLGHKWTEIAEKLNGRSGDMVKNRYHSHIKVKLDKYEKLQQKLSTNEKGEKINNIAESVSQPSVNNVTEFFISLENEENFGKNNQENNPNLPLSSNQEIQNLNNINNNTTQIVHNSTNDTNKNQSTGCNISLLCEMISSENFNLCLEFNLENHIKNIKENLNGISQLKLNVGNKVNSVDNEASDKLQSKALFLFDKPGESEEKCITNELNGKVNCSFSFWKNKRKRPRTHVIRSLKKKKPNNRVVNNFIIADNIINNQINYDKYLAAGSNFDLNNSLGADSLYNYHNSILNYNNENRNYINNNSNDQIKNDNEFNSFPPLDNREKCLKVTKSTKHIIEKLLTSIFDENSIQISKEIRAWQKSFSEQDRRNSEVYHLLKYKHKKILEEILLL